MFPKHMLNHVPCCLASVNNSDRKCQFAFKLAKVIDRTLRCGIMRVNLNSILYAFIVDKEMQIQKKGVL